MRTIQVLGLITFGVILFVLAGCDSEYARLQAEADWNAKVAHAAVPEKGELVTIRQFADGRYIVRRYQGGLKRTDIIAKDD